MEFWTKENRTFSMKIIKNEVIRGQMEAQHNVIDETKEQ